MIVKKMKILLFILVILFLNGCTTGSFTMTNGNISFNDQEISGSYHYFKGYKQKSYQFNEGDTLKFANEISTESGSLQITVKDNDDEIIHEIKDNGNSEVQIIESGKHRIRIGATDHEGSFHLSWVVE